MNRERAKELLPIIQAYAEGKTIQYIGVGFENWHDVDNELEIDSMRYKYRIKPESKYNEIFKEKLEIINTINFVSNLRKKQEAENNS